MGFTLDKVVPWGRSYEEYSAMFGLIDTDFDHRILGCGDGPAGFNAELTKRGGQVVSVDPLYAFSATQIRNRISETYKTVMAQMHLNHANYIWSSISSVEELGHVRTSAMDLFLADYDIGKRSGRYVTGELPLLPFASKTFDIALSSHFLFLYSELLSVEFHLQSFYEMLRVAREVRVFPLLALDGISSPHLNFVVDNLSDNDCKVEIKLVPYEFQRGGNEMLVVKHTNPDIE